MADAAHAPRKEPKQERSKQMRARILAASIRVLQREGALGFTTTRVAEEAEISVGSLYQYFPNKRALVIAMHGDDVARGWAHVRELMAITDRSARERLVDIATWFFASEADEVREFGAAMDDIEVFLRDDGSRHVPEVEALERISAFITEGSSVERTPSEQRFAAAFLWTTIESVGKSVAGRQLSPQTTRRWATTTAVMLSDYLGFA
jgi:AcrR family transcriptional regulator